MPRRVFWFLVAIVGLISLQIILPVMERLSQEGRSLNTSVSVSPFGYKALYLLMDRVRDEPVSLWQHSMMRLSPEEPRTVWLVEPGHGLFFDGEHYGKHIRRLVNSGHHLILVTDARRVDEENALDDSLEYFNDWLDLDLDTYTVRMEEVSDVAVKSHFPTRTITHLSFREMDMETLNDKFWQLKYSEANKPLLKGIPKDKLGRGRVLLETASGDPLIVRYPVGKGSLTFFPNAFFFGNRQLDQGENAALAVALEETNPNPEAVFEVYSLGFNENRDFITFLATSDGVVFLVTMVVLLVMFCLWIALMPVRRRDVLAISNERYFTQEVFIGALARHYVDTGDWTGLYRKLLEQFKRDIESRYPGLPLEEQLKRLAESPFYNVSLAELRAVFDIINVASERDFEEKARQLLNVQRKVNRHEPYQPGTVSPAAAVAVTR